MKCGTNQKTCERLTATGYFENCHAQTHMATTQQLSKSRAWRIKLLKLVATYVTDLRPVDWSRIAGSSIQHLTMLSLAYRLNSAYSSICIAYKFVNSMLMVGPGFH